MGLWLRGASSTMVGYICKIDAADSEEITEVIRGTVCIVLNFILKKGGRGALVPINSDFLSH